MSWTTELKVGAFVVGFAALLAGAWVATFDGVRSGEDFYTATVRVPSADGLWVGTPVRLAGVDVGAIHGIEVVGSEAELLLRIRSRYSLPTDTLVELRSTGMLGERFVTVIPGDAATFLADAGRLSMGEPPLDLDALGQQAQRVAGELEASAVRVRSVLEDEENLANLEASLAHLAETTANLAATTARNRHDIDAIVASVRRTAEQLEQLVATSSPAVERELSSVAEATDTLNRVLADLESITGKVDRGDGTLGALINERELADQLSRTLDDVSSTLTPQLHADAWATGAVYGGDGTGGTVGGRFGETTWGSFELVALPDEPVRPSLQIHQRVGPASFHLGMKEGSEGVGAAAWALEDRLRLQADAFDFTERHGPPNLRVGLRAEPIPRIWLEAGGDELIDEPRAYGGIGVHLDRP